MERKERKSNFELLRIFAMVLIIAYHYVYHSKYIYGLINDHDFFIRSFWLFGQVGVNLFMLISGYFLVCSKFSWKKVIKLILEVTFYYILGIIIYNSLFPQFKISFNSIRKFFINGFPIINGVYWFAPAYIIIYIFSPYINKMINALSQKEYKNLLITSLVLWSILPTIFGFFYGTTSSLLFYSSLVGVFIMYLIGGYIRIYDLKFMNKKSIAFSFYLIFFLIELLAILIMWKLNFRNVYPLYFFDGNSILQVLISVSIFMFFKNINMKNNATINYIASTTFGIYLFHDGIQINVWRYLFEPSRKLSLPLKYAIPQILFFILIIFELGMCVDFIRQLLEKIVVDPIFKKIFDKNKSKE